MLPVGSPAVGKDFVDRDDEIKIIFDSLEKDNILLIAPRRYGKTSIMKKIQTTLSGKGCPVIFIDIHDVNSPAEFLIELATGAFDMAKNKKPFIEKMKTFFSGRLEGLEELEISLGELKFKFKRSLKEEIKSDWKEEGKTLFTFIRDYFDDCVYFIIDEFSECVHNMSKKKKEAEMFLKWFRTVRMEESNLRFILGGSVSIERAVKNVTALSAINDFRRVTIGGFDKETALCAVKMVFDQEKWVYTDDVGEKIVACIGVPSVPHFLSAFLSIIQEESMGKDLNENRIEELYSNNFMGANGKYYFDYYVQRLNKRYDKKEKKAARSILKELCQTGEISVGIAFDIFKRDTTKDDYDWFIDFISDLENDFYLKKDRDKIVFYSKPLADWWRLYHV